MGVYNYNNLQLQQKQEKVSKVNKSQIELGIFTATFLIQYFSLYDILPSQSHALKLIKRKVQVRKSFDSWYNTVICATLCVNFSSKSKATNVSPKHILKSKARDKLIQARKKLFCHVIVKNYLCYVLRKILIKFAST